MAAPEGPASDDNGDPRRALVLPFATIGKIILVLFALWVIYRLTTVIELLLVAIVLAIAFDPAVDWLERRRLPRWTASTLVVFMALAMLGGFLVVCGSSLASQGRQVLERLIAMQQQLAVRLPPSLSGIFSRGQPAMSELAGYALAIGTAVANAVVVGVIACLLTVYLLIDGARTWEWVVAYVPRRNRGRAQQTAEAARRAVQHYFAGNLTTASCAAVVVFVALSLLHVPAVLLLTVLAAICDFVPVIGFIVSGVPAILLALTVSTGTMAAVIAVYVAYHLMESYVIAPRVYGGQLRLSNLAVLLAFVVGAELAGAVGAVLALPAAAMYPVIEEIWLGKYLGRDAVEAHKRLEKEG